MQNFIFALVEVISVLANIFAIIASGIAIYLFLFKIDSLKAIFHILINYTYQISLNELTKKLDEINKLSANQANEKSEIVNIFNDIEGQLRGNKHLKENCEEIIIKIYNYTNNPRRLTEPMKRSLVSELRETLRGLNMKNYKDMLRRQ